VIQFSNASQRRTFHLRQRKSPESKRYISRVPARLREQQEDIRQNSGEEAEWDPLLEFRKAKELADNDDGKNPPLTPSVQPLETSDNSESSDAVHKGKRVVDPDEEAAIHARNEYGHELPEDLLSEQQLLLYKRLYGNPKLLSKLEMETDETNEDAILQRENKHGVWEPIEENRPPITDELIDDGSITTSPNTEDPTNDSIDPRTIWPEDPDYVRTHPLTLASRWGTNPSTIPLPQTTLNQPIATLLSSSSASRNPKHLATAAESLLGGVGLPYSPSSPALSRIMPQRPVPLSAGQTRMSDSQADVFLAAVVPQTYAAVMGVLVEVRKRLGGKWLRGLMEKKNGVGPLVLDVGGGGAGVLAWREIVRAEREVILEERGEGGVEETAEVVKNPIESLFGMAGLKKDGEQPKQQPQAPFGKATVVTGSDTLRYRSSRLLENTTFIPRIPDLVHEDTPEGASPRKQYDIIIAPHSLWTLSHEHERKVTVETLWSLLNPAGGILILLEKGVPRGFEAIAGARELLLKQHIAQPPSNRNEQGEENENTLLPLTQFLANSIQSEGKDEGMIVAPCTNHSVCPLYKTPGIGQGRKDWCHFSQRYIRPPFLQSVLGAKRRNHDDVEFSYLAVRRGVDLRREKPSIDSLIEAQQPRVQIRQDEESTDKAYLGYGRETMAQEAAQEESVSQHGEALDIFRETEEEPIDGPEYASKGALAFSHAHDREYWAKEDFDPLMLPRVLLTPIKRKGHILIDLCTPMGTYERWLINRRAGKHAWRDARKSKWGDLWALGAWSRDMRRVNLGTVNKNATIKPKPSKKGKKRMTREEAEEMEELKEEEMKEHRRQQMTI
jgi:ribosomal protein RSM22 (predicted rRNA methylase)